MAEKKEPKTYYLGTGRRKTAVARVRISEGKGAISINGRALDHYFTEEKDRAAVRAPLTATELGNRLDITVKTAGGGITGQADAIKQGVARAIKVMFSPPTERKSVTLGHVTAVRARNLNTKSTVTSPTVQAPAVKPVLLKPTVNADGTVTPAVLAAPAIAEDPAIGIVKKLRDGRYLTRDSRMKERKKYGLRGARRGTQFSKR